jgi:uncharacterized protein (DUF1778 family)
MATAQLRERLEARITTDEKDLLKEAATLRGISLTDFVVGSAHEAAIRTLQERHIIEIGRRDQRTFVEAVLNPEPPHRRLRAAAARHGLSRTSRRRRR